MPARAPLYLDTPTGQPAIEVYARDLRAQTDGLQPGVVGTTDLQVAPSGTSLTVQPGAVYVPDGGIARTLYRCEWEAPAAALATTAADPSLPRVDQVIARVRDMSVDGGTNRDWRLEVLTGTPVNGATLDNRLGAAALPPRAVRLADVLMAAGGGTIPAGNVRDRRPWARGAYYRAMFTAFDLNMTTDRTILGAGLGPRLELSGAPLVMSLRCRITTPSVGAAAFFPILDGNPADGAASPFIYQSAGTLDFGVQPTWDTIPDPGSHTVGWAHQAVAGTGLTIYGRPAIPIQVTFREDLRAVIPQQS